VPSTEGPPDVAAASQTSILFEAAAAETPAGLRCRRLLRTVPVRRHLASTRPASQGGAPRVPRRGQASARGDAPIVAFFGGPASSRRPGGGRAGGLGALGRPPTHSAWRGPVVGTHLGRYAGPPCVGALLPDGNRVLMDSDSLCAFNVPGSEMAVRAAAMAPRARSYLERPPCSCKLHSDAPLIGTAMPSRCSRVPPPGRLPRWSAPSRRPGGGRGGAHGRVGAAANPRTPSGGPRASGTHLGGAEGLPYIGEMCLPVCGDRCRIPAFGPSPPPRFHGLFHARRAVNLSPGHGGGPTVSPSHVCQRASHGRATPRHQSREPGSDPRRRPSLTGATGSV
jgi:hypothetical protein